jgi:RNA polymerase sigma-70 factor (ECF subfamily)
MVGLVAVRTGGDLPGLWRMLFSLYPNSRSDRYMSSGRSLLSHEVALMVDRLLVTRCKKGSRDALRRIYEKYGFELTGSLKGYLSKCVANRVRDLMRTNRSRAKALSPEQANSVEQDSSEPSRLIACNEELQLLSSALGELPYEQREVIALHIHGQIRFRVIANSLGISVNTVKGRYRYGIRKLRSILNGEI